MEFLPLFFRLEGKPCLIVGGGAIASRKALLVERAGGQIHVVAPAIDSKLEKLAVASGGSCRLGEYQSSDLDNMFIAISATDDQSLNAAVSKDAQHRHIPVNVVDNPELCSFILPAIVDRSPLVVAVSSGGHSPVLARLVRSKIESLIPSVYGQLATLVGNFRQRVQDKFPKLEQRRHFWESLIEGPIAEMVFTGKTKVAEQMLSDQLEQSEPMAIKGEVYLVGAGPGDPDLLTFKALRLLQKADIVLYDRLVSEPILDLCRRDAEKLYVGKARSDHSLLQSDINELLVTYARQGRCVVRLKGGDPFIFGRGGEEIEQLAAQRIPFQVVPGITAASGCASYSGIPLTHRDYAQSVRFVTGHLKDSSANLPWDELVQGKQTLVFYMGLVGLSIICEQLIKHGRDKNTPIAIIQQGTTQHQRVVIGTLADMPEKVREKQIKAPTLLIVGEVVNLQHKLAWFEPAEV